MAKFTFVKKARKDIYTHGKRVEYISKKGKREGQTLSKLDRTLPRDEDDTIFIHKGESYFWWAFQRGPVLYSKTQPKPSQLTQSTFLSSVYSLGERISELVDINDKDDFDSIKEELLSEIEELKDQCQESLENMPESLQYSPVGELLQERIDELDSWYSDIDTIEVEEIEQEDEETDEEFQERLSELIYSSVSELQGTSYNGN